MLSVDANNYRIVASRGDDHKIRFTVKNSSGVAYDVSANTFKFTCKESLDDALADAMFQRTSPAASGIDLTSAASGIVDVNLIPSNTNALAGIYYYDLEMTESSKVYTLRQGILSIAKDVSTSGVVTSPAVGYELLTALYFQDTVVTTNFYKVTIASGGMIQEGPSTSWPF